MYQKLGNQDIVVKYYQDDEVDGIKYFFFVFIFDFVGFDFIVYYFILICFCQNLLIKNYLSQSKID